MENLKLYIDFVARTNLFNFIIFLSIIIFLIKKFNVPAKLENAQNAIKNDIEASEINKKNSITQLNSIENSLIHIEEEIDEIIKKSEENAKVIGEKILQDSEKIAIIVKENTSKAIENSHIILKNELLKRASLASIEIAKSHLINELSWNQELHDKLIDESIETLKEISWQ